MRGTKCCSTCSGDSSAHTLFRDSTACRFDCQHRSNAFVASSTCLVPNKRFFNGGQVLEGGQQDVSVLWSSDVFDKVSQFLAQHSQNFVFVLDGFCSSRQEVRNLPSHLLPLNAKDNKKHTPSRKGINSSRVLSAPRARAMVDRRRMALRRRLTSSC